jgi:hypothetical protein
MKIPSSLPSQRPPSSKASVKDSISTLDLSDTDRLRVDSIYEVHRKTNYTIRPIVMLTRFVFSVILLPACLSSAMVGASIQCGAGVSESVNLVHNSFSIVWSTLQANYGTLKVGAKVILGLDGAPEGASLTAYVLEASAKADQASATIKTALADSMTRALNTPESSGELEPNKISSDGEALTFQSIISAATIGALFPILLFLAINFILTRLWLRMRSRETVLIYGHQGG